MDNVYVSGMTLQSWFQDGVTLLTSVTTNRNQGKVKLSPDSTVQPTKTTGTSTFVVAAIAGLSIAVATVHTIVPEFISAIVLPNSSTPSVIKRMLLDSLAKIRSLPADWTGYSAPAPVEKSVVAAEQILPALPNIVADALAGLDGDGHVFLKFWRGEKVAYLTVEPNLMHLFVTAPGKPNISIDAAKFQPRVVPEKIVSVLKREFVG